MYLQFCSKTCLYVVTFVYLCTRWACIYFIAVMNACWCDVAFNTRIIQQVSYNAKRQPRSQTFLTTRLHADVNYWAVVWCLHEQARALHGWMVAPPPSVFAWTNDMLYCKALRIAVALSVKVEKCYVNAVHPLASVNYQSKFDMVTQLIWIL